MRVASGRRRSVHIARMPTTGPIASRPNAAAHDVSDPGSSRPTPTIVTAVSRNPVAVWSASADPEVPGGASSLTAV